MELRSRLQSGPAKHQSFLVLIRFRCLCLCVPELDQEFTKAARPFQGIQIHDSWWFILKDLPLAFPYLISETKPTTLLLILVQVHDHSVWDSRKMWAEGNPTKENLDLMNSSCVVFHDLYMVPPFDHVHTRTDHAMLHMDICVHMYITIPGNLVRIIWNDRWHTAYWQEGVSLYGYPLTFIQIADTSCRASCHVQNLPNTPKKYTPNFQFLATTYCMFCSSCPSHVPRETYIDVFISEDLGAVCCDKDTQFRHKGCTMHSTV